MSCLSLLLVSFSIVKKFIPCFCCTVMFKDDSNEMIKITYAGLASRSASLNSVSHFLGGPRNRGDRDIYQIGSITYQLLSGGREPPTSVDMNSDDDDDVKEDDTARSSSGNRQNLFMSRIWKIIPVSKQAKDFVESAMQHGFLTVVQALQHRWITQEPIYLRGTGVTTLTDAKGNGSLVSVRLNLGNRTSATSMNETRGDSIATPFGTTDCSSSEQDMRNLSSIERLPVEMKKDDMQEGEEKILSLSTVKHGQDWQPPVTDAFCESESSSDEESVGVTAAPLKQPAVLTVQETCDTEQAEDESESSDDESVGVAEAPNVPPSDVAPVAEPAPPQPPSAPAVIESPITPRQLRKSTLSSEPMTPESPSQTPADFRDLRELFRQASNDEGNVTMDKLRERLRSTKYTEEEVNSWFSGDHFDDSRNLNYKAVLSEAIRSRRKIERLRVEEAFQKIDKGKQGTFNRCFFPFFFPISNSTNIPCCRFPFTLIAAGFVTVGNLRAVLGSDNSEYIEGVMKEADTKRDGRITHDKFKEVLERWNRTEI